MIVLNLMLKQYDVIFRKFLKFLFDDLEENFNEWCHVSRQTFSVSKNIQTQTKQRPSLTYSVLLYVRFF